MSSPDSNSSSFDQRRSDAEFAVTRELIESRTEEEAIAAVLRAIGEHLGWTVGGFWRLDESSEELVFTHIWHRDLEKAPGFFEANRSFRFRKGEGLPGRVWETETLVWIDDLAEETRFPRLAVMDWEGMRAGVGFPVYVGHELVGVLEFFGAEEIPRDQGMTRSLAGIGSEVGQFIRRIRAESKLRASEERFRTLAEYREQIRQIARQGLVDIMLMSASTNDLLTLQERLFESSHVTPAARANDASDIFVVRGGRYVQEPARPFRTASLDHIQCGHVDCLPDERVRGANLGLYSITFNNRLDEDLVALEEYGRFREEAERKGFRHFLEVFDPNAPEGLGPDELPRFVNDSIARTLAGVAQAGRPVFLKVVYHGPRAMEELVGYDPHLIVGILGGGAGTTYDAFKLIAEAQKYGARVALFGRKINNAENQLAFVEFLRLIVDGAIGPEEAV
ncbi:MAG: GAF domain-containing protein, partial [Gemmatimonadota bacterium]